MKPPFHPVSFFNRNLHPVPVSFVPSKFLFPQTTRGDHLAFGRHRGLVAGLRRASKKTRCHLQNRANGFLEYLRAKASNFIFSVPLIRDWEDLDSPEQRDARTAELEAILQTADLAALVGSLPVLDFDLGLPTFQAWIKANPDTAFALLATRSSVSEARIRPALAVWLEKSPVACSQHLRALPPGPWREQTIALAAQLSLATDPAMISNWFDRPPEGESRQNALHAVINA